MNDLEIAKNVVVDFIKEMNLWEKECNNIEKEVSLSYQEKTERKKELLVKLFNKFCTNKKRTYGRPNVIDYGTNGYYEYDPDKEVIEEVTEENKKIEKKVEIEEKAEKEDKREPKLEIVTPLRREMINSAQMDPNFQEFPKLEAFENPEVVEKGFEEELKKQL